MVAVSRPPPWHGFPDDSNRKESACSVGDLGPIPGLGRSPGEENATHSSILAWKTLWMEEPGPQSMELQSMGSQRVGHSWATHTLTLSRAAPPQLGLWWLVPGRLRLAWAAWPSRTCPSPSVAKSASFLKPALHLSWSKWQDNLCPQLSSLDCLGLILIFFLSSDTRGFWFQTYPQCLPRTGVMNCLVSQSGKRA